MTVSLPERGNWDTDSLQRYLEGVLKSFCEEREDLKTLEILPEGEKSSYMKVHFQEQNTKCERPKNEFWFSPKFEWGAAEEVTIESAPELGSNLGKSRAVWEQDLQIYGNLSYVQLVGERQMSRFFADLARLYREIPYMVQEYGIELCLEGWTGPFTGRFGNQDIKQLIVRYSFQQQ